MQWQSTERARRCAEERALWRRCHDPTRHDALSPTRRHHLLLGGRSGKGEEEEREKEGEGEGVRGGEG